MISFYYPNIRTYLSLGRSINILLLNHKTGPFQGEQISFRNWEEPEEFLQYTGVHNHLKLPEHIICSTFSMRQNNIPQSVAPFSILQNNRGCIPIPTGYESFLSAYSSIPSNVSSCYQKSRRFITFH